VSFRANVESSDEQAGTHRRLSKSEK